MSSSLASPRTGRLLLAAVVAALVLAGLTQRAQAAPAPPPYVPAEIVVPAGHKLFLVAHAVGVQIYTCNGTTWGPGSTPRADLFDDHGTLIGTHFGGPSWQARDGSTVVAERVDGATVDPDAIPWLLLRKVTATAGPGGDRLAGTTYIQRVATTEGKAPASPCTTPGAKIEVPYTADYYFYKSRTA